MKKMFFMLTMAALLSLPALAWAQYTGSEGRKAGDQFANKAGTGYTGDEAPSATVAEALKMPDDARVTLTGKIDRKVGDEKYQFSDSTGTITVEIDDKYWRNFTAGASDTVVIQGEVDLDSNRRELDVKSIAKK